MPLFFKTKQKNVCHDPGLVGLQQGLIWIIQSDRWGKQKLMLGLQTMVIMQF